MYIKNSSTKKLNFFEFTTEHQKELANLAALSDNSFHLHFTNILKKYDSEIEQCTIFEKLIIMLQLRLFYIGSVLKLNLECPFCTEAISFQKNLNDDLSSFDIFDGDFRKTYDFSDIKLVVNIPKVFDEDLMINQISNDWKFLFAETLQMKDTIIDLKHYDLADRKRILERLDLNVADKLNEYFNSILDLKIPNYLQIPCPHCKSTIKQDFNVVNMFFFIKNIFFDFNYFEILNELALLSSKLQLSSELLLKSSPVERKHYRSLLGEDEMVKNHEQETPEEIIAQNTEFGFSH